MFGAPALLFTWMRAARAGPRGPQRHEPTAVTSNSFSRSGIPAEKTRYTLAYDEDCGPCTKFKRAIEFFDAHDAIEFVSLVQANELGLLDAIPEHLRFRSFHLIAPTGRVESGANALRGLIRLLPSGWLASEFIFSTPSGRRLATFAYSSLSRLHDRSSCRPETSLIHGREGIQRSYGRS
jgi:predicted DCC family thiol-disulfide oxidoreductase YuxK